MSCAFEPYNKEDLLNRTAVRGGEKKLGQVLNTLDPEALNGSPIPYKFVIIGVEEDYGVRGNLGRGGAHRAFEAFLRAFCNLQDNRFFPTDQVAVLGALVATGQPADAAGLHSATAAVDAELSTWVEKVVAAGATPIVIGGGHNNAYGCLKGSALGRSKPVHCLNVDAHTDLRALEGRHSGNGFSYALEDGHLAKYFMMGLQENYTPEYIWERIENDDRIQCATREDEVSGEVPIIEVLDLIHAHLGHEFAIELDVDVIANFPSSAQSPSGYTLDEIREVFYALDTTPPYIHLCEGRVVDDESSAHVGKGLALLVADAIKAYVH